jgi:glycosyltransferase involved in cell wall biosynthesis
MKLTILSHSLSSNAAMRAYRLAQAARTFSDAQLVGPVKDSGPWPGLPNEPWIRTVRYKRFPRFFKSFGSLAEAADGDVLIAVKPYLASFGVALVEAERRQVPVILDVDDLDVAFRPPSMWHSNPALVDLAQPKSAIYVSLLTKAASAANAITVSSAALQQRFGGTIVPHGGDTELFNPARVDRDSARRAVGFTGPTVLFAGTPNPHKGLEVLGRAVARLANVRVAVTCRDTDLAGANWASLPLQRIPVVPYSSVPALLAAADVVAIPQLESEVARYQMPMKVFDAMAMGKPIVASAVSDLPHVLDGCGLLVPPGDVDGLARAIGYLLSHPEEARTLGDRARARCVETYSIGQIGKSLCDIVRSVSTRPPGSPSGHPATKSIAGADL